MLFFKLSTLWALLLLQQMAHGKMSRQYEWQLIDDSDLGGLSNFLNQGQPSKEDQVSSNFPAHSNVLFAALPGDPLHVNHDALFSSDFSDPSDFVFSSSGSQTKSGNFMPSSDNLVPYNLHKNANDNASGSKMARVLLGHAKMRNGFLRK